MKKVILAEKLSSYLKQIESSGKTIVLVGGCFDILHVGHTRFLQKAKALGDVLIVLLENDQKIKLIKGKDRPIHHQNDRAEVLSALRSVDFIIMLSEVMENSDYDSIVKLIKPRFIATTKGDPNIKFKERTAKLVNAQVKYVTPLVKSYSTEDIIEKFS